MRMLFRSAPRAATALLLLCAAVAPAAAARSCTISHFNFVFGTDAASTMTTKAGARCTEHITARSAISGGAVDRQPAHGTAFFSEHQFGYQPAPGYTGPDAFSIAMNGTSYRRGRSGSYALDGTTHVSFSVQVVP